jgi:hypothetical protein
LGGVSVVRPLSAQRTVSYLKKSVKPSWFVNNKYLTTVSPVTPSSPVLKSVGSPPCDYFNREKFWCCLDHHWCLDGRPIFYKGFRICALAFEEHDHIVYPTRIRRFWH